MSTSNERHEISERLRKCGAELSIIGADCETGLHVIDNIIGCREEDSWERFTARLADLIDPTTHIGVDEHGRAYCPNCECDDWCLADRSRFCPNCGCRCIYEGVVDDE